MKGKLGDRQRLLHTLEAIKEIRQYTSGADLENFLSNSMMRFASVKQIEIIGEAANYITEEAKLLFTDLEWKQIIGMRHILVHEYFGTDFDLVWQVIINDLPQLEQKVLKAIDFLPSSN